MRVPGEVIVDMEKETRSLILTPELMQAVPDLPEAFTYADEQYENDPEAYLRKQGESVFMVERNGHEAPCSLIYDSETSKSDSILVMFAPFSDGAPETSAAAVMNLIANPNPGVRDKEKAKPNTRNQVTKASVTHDVLEAMGHGMPVLTIYSPVPLGVYSRGERKSISEGNIAPVGELAEAAITRSQEILHGRNSETQLRELNTHGASLGDNAIGSASTIHKKDSMEVASVTAQELIFMDGDLVDLADRYSIRQMVGEPSDIEVPDGTPRIYEPAVRRDIEKHGIEPSTYWRVVKAMTKLPYLKGLTKPDWLSAQVVYLAGHGVDVLVANAVNSHISQETASYLPLSLPHLNYTEIKALKDQKVGHLADEHVALVAGMIAVNIRNSRAAQAS